MENADGANGCDSLPPPGGAMGSHTLSPCENTSDPQGLGSQEGRVHRRTRTRGVLLSFLFEPQPAPSNGVPGKGYPECHLTPPHSGRSLREGTPPPKSLAHQPFLQGSCISFSKTLAPPREEKDGDSWSALTDEETGAQRGCWSESWRTQGSLTRPPGSSSCMTDPRAPHPPPPPFSP